MKLFNYVIEADLGSKHKWSHFRIHKYEMYKHIVWGKLSIIVGQPHLTEIHVCSQCYEQISGLSAGDEGWNYCEGCQQVEGETEYITEEEYERIHN